MSFSYPKTTEISESKFEAVARALKVEVAALKAVAATESSGTPFCHNGLPKIRYERHYFFRATQDKSLLGGSRYFRFAKFIPSISRSLLSKNGGIFDWEVEGG